MLCHLDELKIHATALWQEEISSLLQALAIYMKKLAAFVGMCTPLCCQDHLGEEEFKRLEAAAATRRLLMELREAASRMQHEQSEFGSWLSQAHTEEREPELDIVCEALAQGRL